MIGARTTRSAVLVSTAIGSRINARLASSALALTEPSRRCDEEGRRGGAVMSVRVGAWRSARQGTRVRRWSDRQEHVGAAVHGQTTTGLRLRAALANERGVGSGEQRGKGE